MQHTRRGEYFFKNACHLSQQAPVQLKLVPILIKHNVMEAYGKMEAQLHTCLNSALVAGD
jgi:hypothetical protein